MGFMMQVQNRQEKLTASTCLVLTPEKQSSFPTIPKFLEACGAKREAILSIPGTLKTIQDARQYIIDFNCTENAQAAKPKIQALFDRNSGIVCRNYFPPCFGE